MAKILYSGLLSARQLNDQLLELTCQGQWDEFIELMAEYASLIEDVMACNLVDMTAEEHEDVRLLVDDLLVNEALMVQRMRTRLDVLRKEMTTLNKGKAASNAYAAPFTSSIR